jgi:hypothetical protein
MGAAEARFQIQNYLREIGAEMPTACRDYGSWFSAPKPILKIRR